MVLGTKKLAVEPADQAVPKGYPWGATYLGGVTLTFSSSIKGTDDAM